MKFSSRLSSNPIQFRTTQLTTPINERRRHRHVKLQLDLFGRTFTNCWKSTAGPVFTTSKEWDNDSLRWDIVNHIEINKSANTEAAAETTIAPAIIPNWNSAACWQWHRWQHESASNDNNVLWNTAKRARSAWWNFTNACEWAYFLPNLSLKHHF